MPVDHDLLRSLARSDDLEAGYSEAFVRLSLRSGGSLGVLSQPLERRSDVGWVLCHSFAREQAELMPAEGAIARGLSAAGFPVLRFQCQGYGDCEHPELRATPASHLEDTLDAIDAFREMAGVERIGLVGIRVGAFVATQAVDHREVDAVAMIAPVLNGRRYIDQVVRGLVMTRLAMRSRPGIEGPETAEAIRDQLAEQGSLDYKGYVLTAEVAEEVSRFDLIRDLGRVPSRALVVQVSASERPQAGQDRLVAALERGGASVDRETVLHRQAALYGMRHVRIVARDMTADVFADAHEHVANTVAAWANGRLEVAA